MLFLWLILLNSVYFYVLGRLVTCPNLGEASLGRRHSTIPSSMGLSCQAGLYTVGWPIEGFIPPSIVAVLTTMGALEDMAYFWLDRPQGQASWSRYRYSGGQWLGPVAGHTGQSASKAGVSPHHLQARGGIPKWHLPAPLSHGRVEFPKMSVSGFSIPHISIPGEGSSCLPPAQEALWDPWWDLTQAPFKLLTRRWDLDSVRFSACPLSAES